MYGEGTRSNWGDDNRVNASFDNDRFNRNVNNNFYNRDYNGWNKNWRNGGYWGNRPWRTGWYGGWGGWGWCRVGDRLPSRQPNTEQPISHQFPTFTQKPDQEWLHRSNFDLQTAAF